MRTEVGLSDKVHARAMLAAETLSLTFARND